MQAKLSVQIADFLRRQQLRVHHANFVERAVEAFAPEFEEIVEFWKVWRQIIILPEIGLDEDRVIGQPVQNLRRGKAVSLQLSDEIPVCHIAPDSF